MLASFYDEIYQGERNFGDGENLPAFADEGEPEDGGEDYQDDINDEGDDPGAEDENPNRDEDAEEDDEPAATEAIQRKQKFSSFEKVCTQTILMTSRSS